MSVDLERLRSVAQVGKTRGRARVRRLVEGGRVRAIEVDHADGRRSAAVRPDVVHHTVRMSEL